MLIRLIKGMNVPQHDGSVSPASPGAVVEMPDRLARQQIALRRAEIAEHAEAQVVPVEDREEPLKRKLAKR